MMFNSFYQTKLKGRMNLWKRFKRYLSTDAYLERRGIFYRRVVEYKQDGDGEIVTLECGHRFHMVIMRRAMFPCEDCAALAKARGETPQPPEAT